MKDPIHFVLNGRNHEIKGDRPICKWKALAAGALGAFAAYFGAKQINVSNS